ncbi:hypothetical protein CYY_004163 [Polysphondylium violaceum]|uniref:TRAF-type domain-containing protein n=1 Tax=Polysphondylium violaceum TaxID=133409 RepID=A0A8J4UT75_9MYCE|nr:hypothetical protein CYY_004163 [Polysphondylium violaceum]
MEYVDIDISNFKIESSFVGDISCSNRIENVRTYYNKDPTSLEQDLKLDNIILDEDFECVICKMVVTKQYSCHNGHNHCFDCWSKSLDIDGVCPQCKQPVKKDSLVRNRFYEASLFKLHVNCPLSLQYSIDGGFSHAIKECDKMTLSELMDKHIYKCQYRKVKCVCDQEIYFINLEQHYLQCPKTIFICEHCKSEYNREDNDEHLSSCPDMKVPCSNGCNVDVKRSELLYHLSQDCNKTMISCPLKDVGCQDSFQRDELCSHLKLYNSHLGFILKVAPKVHLLSNDSALYNELRQVQSDYDNIVFATDIMLSEHGAIDIVCHQIKANFIYHAKMCCLTLSLQSKTLGPDVNPSDLECLISFYDKDHQLKEETALPLNTQSQTFSKRYQFSFINIKVLKISSSD